jgi:uncharacterized integral membrane protein
LELQSLRLSRACPDGGIVRSHRRKRLLLTTPTPETTGRVPAATNAHDERILLAVAVIILAAQNTASTTISFLGWEFSTPLIVVILGTLLVGVIFDEIFGLVYRARRRRTLAERDQLKRINQANTDSNSD